MTNKSIISHLKSCCLALGLTKKNDSNPVSIAGTGFFVDPDAYFVTADHVITGMEKMKKIYQKKGIELEYRGFRFEEIDEKSGQLVAIKIEHGRSIHLDIENIGDFIPEKQDLMMGKLSGKYDLPYLRFDQPTKIGIFDEVFMCGYPGGQHSLKIQDVYGHRMSPILQHGRISSLLPIDQSENPFGIQTDIIGTGGSSGSPIVDANTEQVLGIAQQIIPSNVFVDNQIGSAKIGLVWGISNYFFSDSVKTMLKILKTEFDKNGIPLPKEQTPETIHQTDIFHPEKR